MLKKLLSDSTASKFVTRKWIEVNDLSGSQYSVNKNLRFKTTFVRSNQWNYSDAYIILEAVVGVLAGATNKNDKAEKKVAFRLCISKINNTLIDNTEDLDIVMSITICQNVVTFIKWHLEGCGIIIETKLVMLMIVLHSVNRLNIRQK